MSKYPFLDRIPEKRLADVMNGLYLVHSKRHWKLPQAVSDYNKTHTLPDDTAPTIRATITHDTEQEMLDGTNYEMSQNTDVKERIE